MSTNKEQTLRQFCDVTGADEGRSKFFLESSNWQLDVALSSFYEHGGNIEDAPANPATGASSLPTLSDSDMESPPGSPLTKKKEKKKPSNTKFATLDSLHQESSSDEEEESKYGWTTPNTYYVQDFCSQATCSKYAKYTDTGTNTDPIDNCEQQLEQLKKEVQRLMCENRELQKEIEVLKERLDEKADEGQAFYAGGSERSGQQIIGPGKGRKDIVTEVFKSVRERGAVVFEDEPSSTSRGRSAFSGVGYRLGQTADDHEPVSAAGQPGQQQQSDEPRSVRLRLYREGFTVDSGPLRHYSDPDHADFLNCIRRGEIPSELAGGGGEVRVSLEDRRHEECPRNIAKQQAFTGKGHLLGSPTPAVVGAPASVTLDAGDRAANVRAAQLALNVDDTKPTTTVQFRLADGTRLTGRFNHTHTVADLHQYVSRAEPIYQLQNFVLLTTFPSTELTDPVATIEQAKILNTTLLQRLK